MRIFAFDRDFRFNPVGKKPCFIRVIHVSPIIRIRGKLRLLSFKKFIHIIREFGNTPYKKSKENLRASYVVQILCLIYDRLRKINFMLP